MDFIHLAQFLTKLPEDISSNQLFRNIQAIRLSIDKKKFAQVLAGHREARERSDYFWVPSLKNPAEPFYDCD